MKQSKIPTIDKVNERVYCARGFAISNVIFILTDTSAVVIDATESLSAAGACLEEFRNISMLPVSHIIYTHFHGDHTRGAEIFHGPNTTVIAHDKLPVERAKIKSIWPYRQRVTSLQFGSALPRGQRGASLAAPSRDGYIPPDVTFADEYRFESGGVRFELYHTEGETFDHLMVWLPAQRTLLPGDLFYFGFPMLSNPMGADRPVLAWADSLERMRTLRPEYLIPSHGRSLRGEQVIDDKLKNYARAIRYVHDETVRGINEGLGLQQIRDSVVLPDDLACLPYLRPSYGTLPWAVNGIFRQYTGWYDFDPAHLNPSPHGMLQRALLDATGGPAQLIARAQRARRVGQEQLALELADIVLAAHPRHKAAEQVRLRALKRLGATTSNGVERNIYRTAARGVQPARPPIHCNRSGAGGRHADSEQRRSSFWDGVEGVPAPDSAQPALVGNRHANAPNGSKWASKEF